MKIFSTAQVRLLDAKTIESEPISSINLMERAAAALFSWFAANVDADRPVDIFCGPGNNGGDGLALARMLFLTGYPVRVFYLHAKRYSDDFSINLNRLKELGIPLFPLENQIQLPDVPEEGIIVDSLFGSGLSRSLDGFAAKLVEHINRFSRFTVAIDIPSGLFGEENPVPNSNPVVRADVTLSLQFPKLSFFFRENESYVGQWVVLPIGIDRRAIEQTDTPYFFLDADMVRGILKSASCFDHKGTFGHCRIIAGSKGMIGAAVLAARAAVRSGAGLVSLQLPRCGYSVAQQAVPEAMCLTDRHADCISDIVISEGCNAFCLGPGLGVDANTEKALVQFLKTVSEPLLLDADALNLIARDRQRLALIPPKALLTPHPGEFDRLFGLSGSDSERLKRAVYYAGSLGVVIVLKGAYTRVVLPDGRVFFNSTGNPGMATGGSGDTLSGLMVGLLAQGYSPENAALLAVYIHGKAGDIARDSSSREALSATDISLRFGEAFSFIRIHTR